MGENIIFSHGSNRTGDEAICFNKCPGKVITFKADGFGHWLAVVLNIEGIFNILVNIYGFNSNHNKMLLSEVKNVVTEYKEIYHIKLILIGGDLNLTPDEWQNRYPSKYNTNHRNAILCDFLNSNNFLDI